MSSGFVSGGTTEQPRERNELWQKAEQELEAARQRKLEQKNHDGKSLYEVLQENKAAKQEAFEESIKLKHQFRSLDEDDVAFLNSIRDSETEKEQAVQQETLNQLDAFRKQQQGQTGGDDDSRIATNPEPGTVEDDATWVVAAKKRKREQNKPLKGVKAAKLSTATQDRTAEPKKEVLIASETNKDVGRSEAIAAQSKLETNASESSTSAKKVSISSKHVDPPPPASTPALGLVGYSSDED